MDTTLHFHPGTDLAGAYDLPFALEQIEAPEKEWAEFDGIFVLSIHFKKAGIVALQHVHDYDHGTFVARGSVRVFRKDQPMDYTAPAWIMIEAETPHAIQALEDNSMCWCAHNSALHPEVLQEAQE